MPQLQFVLSFGHTLVIVHLIMPKIGNMYNVKSALPLLHFRYIVLFPIIVKLICFFYLVSVSLYWKEKNEKSNLILFLVLHSGLLFVLALDAITYIKLFIYLS